MTTRQKILLMLSNDQRPSWIGKELGLSKQSMYQYMNQFIREGLIVKYNTPYKLTKQGLDFIKPNVLTK
jgi:predicted transcriptional regulator